MNKIKLTVLIITGIILFSVSCKKSSLSDVELTDPSILRFYGYLDKKTDTLGIQRDSIYAIITDKMPRRVELKKGGIYVNDLQGELSNDILFGPFYKFDIRQIQIENNETYNFRVILADDSDYESPLTLPEDNLDIFIAPLSHNANDTLTVSWNEVDNLCELSLEWRKSVTDSTYLSSGSTWGDADVSGTHNYDFPPSFFEDSTGTAVVNNLYLDLYSIIRVDANSSFNRGHVQCRYIIKKTINILH